MCWPSCHLIGLVFLWSLGWICANPAVAAEGGKSETTDTRKESFKSIGVAEQVKPPAGVESQAGSLFDEDHFTLDQDRSTDIISDEQVSVGSFGQISLHVKDLEVAKILQLLSIQSERNIVASRNVAGTVSADLYNVNFYEALDAILHPNGFSYQEKGKFIYVYTTAELKMMADAQQPLMVKLVRLNYIPAADAAEFVKPLLSENGTISVNAPPAKGIQPTLSDVGENSFAHPDTLLIRDTKSNVDQILGVLKELDVRPKQVLVEATILEARLTEDNAFGVDLTMLADFNMADFVNPHNVIDNLVNGNVGGRGQAVATTVGGIREGNAGLRVGIISDNVAMFIKALDSVTDTTILAHPKLLVLNRQRADLLIGQRLGYLSTSATETSTTQTVEFLDVGTQLSVRPFVGDDDFIRLELRPSISDGNTVAVGGFVIPNTNTEEMITNVIVRNGQTVVLGGLFKEDTGVTRRQVPFLGDIPIAGAPFRGQDDNVARFEVIFLIKTSIVKDQYLFAEGERVMDAMEFARAGARQELLPWSRTKLVASHIRDALECYQQGEKDKALWSVNMALMLDPTIVEGRRLKEALTAQRVYWPRHSILKEAADQQIEKALRGADVKRGDSLLDVDLREGSTSQHAAVVTATSPERDQTDAGHEAVDSISEKQGSEIEAILDLEP